MHNEDDNRYHPEDRKDVVDSDGFMTDYTMYYDDLEDKYVFIFGDADIYNPNNTEPDFECETQDEAYEWLDSYVGPGEDEDLYESKRKNKMIRKINESINLKESKCIITLDGLVEPDESVELLNTEFLPDKAKAAVTNNGQTITIYFPSELRNEIQKIAEDFCEDDPDDMYGNGCHYEIINESKNLREDLEVRPLTQEDVDDYLEDIADGYSAYDWVDRDHMSNVLRVEHDFTEDELDEMIDNSPYGSCVRTSPYDIDDFIDMDDIQDMHDTIYHMILDIDIGEGLELDDDLDNITDYLQEAMDALDKILYYKG